ncbi:MAG: 50S ribosome-binding GTPase [Hadesarchaea archaeon]|nr:50S ribosome-binding GTPase [Hadesarchaea archaeon]
MAKKLEFRRLPAAPSPDELLTRAFRRASRAADALRAKRKPITIAKLREAERIRVMSQTIRKTLTKLVTATPSLSNLPPFYKELVAALVNVDDVRKSLGAIDGTAKIIRRLEREHIRRLRAVSSLDGTSAIRRQAYGRISSTVRRASDHLAILREAEGKLADIPSVFIEMSTIVIAGYPNVGKTMLLRRLTGSEPKIAPYPFTTKGLNLGYFERGYKRYQIIDTPGLLDRPLEERNPVERQAIAALRHLADVVVFMLDPSGTCGYDFERQLHLLEDIRKTFSNVIVVINKTDLLDEQRVREVQELCKDAIFISAATGQGIPELEKIKI